MLRDLTDRPALLARFVAVGAFNTLLGYLLYALFLAIGLHYAAANLGSIMIGVPLGFWLHRQLVFRPARSSESKPDRSPFGKAAADQFARFVLVWVLIYGFSTLLIKLVVSLGPSAYWAGLLVLPINTVLSFLANRYWVFRPSR